MTHVVVSGDSCSSIAQIAGTTVDIILANNPNVNSTCGNIYPGEVRRFGHRLAAVIALVSRRCVTSTGALHREHDHPIQLDVGLGVNAAFWWENGEHFASGGVAFTRPVV